MDENLVNKLVAERAAPLESVDDVRRKFAPARTLGAGEDAWLAEDAMLEESGVYGLIQHSFAMGQPQFPEFIGYSVLQGLSQNGLIRACIETTTDDMTREWITVRQEALEDYINDRLIDKINKAMKKFKLQKLFHDAVDLVGYEGGAMIFIDTGAEGADLLAPLPLSWDNAELSLGGLKRFVLVDPVNVFPGTYNSTNPLRPDYYVPQTWHVLGQQVHSSRLIRLVANECPTLLKPAYNFFGLSQAQILWDYVLHFQECRVAAQRLATKSSLTVFKTELRSILFGAGGTQQLDRRIKYFMQNRDNEGVAVIDKDNEDLIKIESQLTGMSDIVRQSLELLAALNRTPAVKLLGISPSGFNATGESDLRNYYDHIKSQQEKILRPAIETCLDAIQVSENGTIDRGITFDFNPLRDEDKFTIASYQKAKAETASIYLQSGVVSPDEVRQAIADDEDSGFSQIDPDVETEEPPQQGGSMPMGGMMGMDSELDDDDIAEDRAKSVPDGWRWVTSRGRRILIDENGTIQAGLGGKFNGKSISELGSGEDKPSSGKSQKSHTYTAAELGGTEFTSKTGKTFIHVPSVEKFCDLLQVSRDANNIVDPANTWRVSAPNAKDFAEEHPNAKCFTTSGGSAFAVSEDGDIVSVCLCPGDTTIGGGDLVRMALEHGGKKLDSFTGNHEFYVHMGFEPVSLCTWNPEFKPDMWVEGKHHPENIIFYRYTGKPDDPKWKKKPEEIEPLLPHFDDYGEAQKFRDARLSDGIAQDANPDQWITVHPNGDDSTGQHVLLDGDTGAVKAGMGGKFNGTHIQGVPGYRGSSGKLAVAPVTPEEPKEPEKPKKPKRAASKKETAQSDFNQAKERGLEGLRSVRKRSDFTRVELFENYLEERKDDPLVKQYLALIKELDESRALLDKMRPRTTEAAPSPIRIPDEMSNLLLKVSDLYDKCSNLQNSIIEKASKSVAENKAKGKKLLNDFVSAFEEEVLKTVANSDDLKKFMEAPLGNYDFIPELKEEVARLTTKPIESIVDSMSSDEAVALTAGIYQMRKALNKKVEKACEDDANGAFIEDKEAGKKAASVLRRNAILGVALDVLQGVSDKTRMGLIAESRVMNDSYSDKAAAAMLFDEAKKHDFTNEADVARNLGDMERQILRAVDSKSVYNSVRPLKTAKTEEEIIASVNGFDSSKGNCVSQAIAYVAQKFGYDVTDRQTATQPYFSTRGRRFFMKLGALAEEKGIPNCYYDSGTEALREGGYRNMVARLETTFLPKGSPRQVISCMGRHCAVLRRNPQTDEIEYLELQHSGLDGGGWKTLTAGELIRRFKYTKSRCDYVFLALDALKNDMVLEAFRTAAGYLNTRRYEEEPQK